jgi:two-component system, chemotaxis family, sensor histidine kinase and response regulator PixL
MINDPAIREQAYQYFLEEIPELLQIIEQELFSLNDDFLDRKKRSLKINGLMRATHTLKGGAANVGLETIKTIAHTLEDLYKALYNPELEIDSQLQSLLFESYECLRLPLTAELTKTDINHAEILDRAAAIFALLQDKLGDYLTDQEAFPSSEELGLDVVDSFFTQIVPERLQELFNAIKSAEVGELTEVLRSQAEVFVGLAESLGLPGLQAIAENILRAMDSYPDRIVEIAEVALDNLQQAQVQVLEGDRQRGGEPSEALLKLSGQSSIAQNSLFSSQLLSTDEVSTDRSSELIDEIWGQQDPAELTSNSEDFTESELCDTSLLESSIIETVSSEILSSQPDQLIDEIWGKQIQPESVSEKNNQIAEPEKQELISSEITTTKAQERTKSGKGTSIAQTVRINLESLDRLNNLMGELLIDQNKNVLKHKNIYDTVQELTEKLYETEQIISSLNELLVGEMFLGTNERQSSDLRDSKTKTSETIALLESAAKNSLESIKMAENIRTFNQHSHRNLQKQQRILLNMRDELIETRMSPIGRVFNRFPPMIEQLANVHGKKIELKIIGGHTLVDKAIEDKLYEPLLHLLRNSFDHGIETPEARCQLGKPEMGRIELRAYYQGSQTIIEVEDDGNGLDLEKIKKRALEKNLLPAHLADKVSDSQLLEFLFESGFSTASKVSDLSGRGVGLDVVRSQIEAIKGIIAIESTPKQGTTFSLQIPLTLTIAKLMLCEANGVVYGLLVDAIERILLPTAEQIQVYKGQKVLQWRNATQSDTIPVRKLSDLIEYARIPQSRIIERTTQEQQINNPILLLRQNAELLSLEVDRVLGEQELVIRPLSSAIAPPNYIYGCSVLSNSSLTLVVDAIALIKETQSGKTYQTQRAYLANYSPQALPSARITPQLPPGISNTSHTLLVVDDSSSLRKTIKLSLQKISSQILEAENGLKGLSTLQKAENVSLVVCDVEMPHMNGFQFLKAVGQNPKLAHIPIVILTSRNTEQFRTQAKELGAAAFFIKPYNEGEFLKTINDLLARHSSQSVKQEVVYN